MMNKSKLTGKRRSDMDPPLNIGKRIKVQAQRKFAQGAAVLPFQQQKEFSSSTDGFKENPKETTFKIQTEKKSSTEDFLTYVCFKGSPSYNIMEPHLVSSSRKTFIEGQLPAEPKSLTTSMGDVQGFVPFGVRKQASQHPVKSTVLLEAIKNSKKDLRKKLKSSKLSKNNLDSTKQMQTRSSKIIKTGKSRSNGQANSSPVFPSPKAIKQTPKKVENNMLNKEMSLRARVIRFNNKPTMKKGKDVTKNKNTVDKISPSKESNKDSPPKNQPKTEEKSCRFTRNMSKNLKDTPEKIKAGLQTRSTALNKKSKTSPQPKRLAAPKGLVSKGIKGYTTEKGFELQTPLQLKRSAAKKEVVTPDSLSFNFSSDDEFESKAVPVLKRSATMKEINIKFDFSSDDDQPLLKKPDSEKHESEDKPKAEPVTPVITPRVTRSKQCLSDDKQQTPATISVTPLAQTSQQPTEGSSWLDLEPDDTINDIQEFLTWEDFLEESKKYRQPPENFTTSAVDPPKSTETNKAKTSNDRKRRFPFIDTTIVNPEASLQTTKRFAKSILTTDLDQQVIEESIRNMLKETTVSKIRKSTNSTLEKSFSESDEEPLAAKIQETSVKTRVTDRSQNNATLTTTTTTRKPTTDLSAIANNLTKKIIDSQQKMRALYDVESTTVNLTTESSQVYRRRPGTRRSWTPPGSIINEIDRMADPRLRGRIVPLTTTALQQEVTKINIGRRVFKNNDYIENWLDECSKVVPDIIHENYLGPDIIEPIFDGSQISNMYSVNNTLRAPPINTARPFSNMVADIDSRLEKNKYAAMSQLCLNSNSRMFEATPYVEPERTPVNEVLNIQIPENTLDVNIYDFESESEEILPPRMIKEGEWKSRQPEEQQTGMKGFLPYNSTRKSTDFEPPPLLCENQPTFGNTSSTVVEIHHPPNIEPTYQIQSTMSSVPNHSIEHTMANELSAGNTEDHLFYLPIHGVTKDGKSVNHIIEGVAVKRDTHGPGGQKEKIIMKAKLVMKSDVDNTKLQTNSADIQLTSLPDNSFKQIEQRPLNQSTGKKMVPTASVPPLNTNTMNAVAKSSNCQSPMNTPPSASIRPLPSTTRSSAAGNKPGPSTWINKGSKNTNQANNTAFPQSDDPTCMVNAPVFHPTEKEFLDPIEFIEKITPIAAKYGLCRIVPPASFKSECKISDDMRFTPHNQYLHRMFYRWGTSTRELCAIKKYLATQNVSFKQPPSLCGIEVDLPKMYHVVQNMGGLKKVLEKKLWMKVAEEMCIPNNGHYIDGRLDDIYCKYLLPYDTLSNAERQKLFAAVDKQWEKRQTEMIARASNPLNPPTETEQDDLEHDITEDIEECITRGKSQTLTAYTRTAKNTMTMQFGKVTEPRPDEVEAKFWDYVTNRKNHICVSTGSIDSSVWGYGFPNAKIKNSPLSKHPWNLKVLTNNSGSVLRSIGPIMGVTVPTLHVGMVFSTCCWYRDPHGLPWVEYLHEGAPKIWYGVPDSQSQKFQEALTSLVPGYCQQKTIWLLSDTTMVPPTVLTEHGVSLCRTVQNPGEFILVFPKAYTSSICTGFNVSESVYFATSTWLETACQDFMDIRNSCEPSMFSLEKLIIAISEDTRSPYDVLKQILPMLDKIVQNEKQYRDAIYNIGIKKIEKTGKKKARKYQEEGEECHRCRTNLSLSMVCNPEDGGVFCLMHGVEYLRTNHNQVANSKLVYTHTTTELDKILRRLMERITLRSTNKKNVKAK